MPDITHAQSLAIAVLITALLHGSLLWKMDDMATQGAAGQAHSTRTSPPENGRHIILERVVITGG